MLKNFIIKIFKIVILLILTFLILEFVCYSQEVVRVYKAVNDFISYPLKKTNFDINNFKDIFRKPCGLQYKKAPILIYGSSYTYGYNLKEDEHPGYIMAKLAKRPVYNYALERIGFQHMLNIMQNQEPVLQAPEYVFVFYGHDLVRRMFVVASKIDDENFLNYVEKNGRMVLKKDKFPYLKNNILYRTVMQELYFPNLTQEQKFYKLLLFLKEMKIEMQKKYPSAKFIFVIYDRNHTEHLYITDDMIERIKKCGIEVISLDDIFGDELYGGENRQKEIYNHPSAAAWKKIVPALIKIKGL